MATANAKANTPDPLADLRAPVEAPPAQEPAKPELEQEAPAEQGLEVVTDADKARSEIIQARHADRYMATGLHKGGVCLCRGLASVALEVSKRNTKAVRVNSEGEEGGDTQ